MSVAGHSPPPFFKRGPAPLARLFFFASVSVILLVADLRFHTLEWARAAVATALLPVQEVASAPVEALADLGGYFGGMSGLKAENETMRRDKLARAGLLLRQEHLEQENLRLRELLDMRARQPAEGRLAEIIYAAPDPFARRVIIGKGTQAGIEDGQAVVDESGVLGQVTRTYPLTSEVTLLTDKNQAIPVQVQRNGLRAILFGAGAGATELRFLPPNADVQVGDILVTSGLDGVFLPGLPVAKVIRTDRDSAYSFAHIACEPLAGVERHGLVLVLGRRLVPPLPKSSLAAEAPAPKKGKRRK